MPLHERITEIFDDHDDAIDRARRGREVFEESYSYEAASAVVAPMFERLLDATPAPADRLAELVEIPGQRFRSHRRRASPPVRIPGRRGKPIARGGRFDVVVFWKQNDTGIYGRRQDMFVKYLARSDRVRSIVHFDNPTTPERLYKVHRRAGAEATDQGRLIVRTDDAPPPPPTQVRTGSLPDVPVRRQVHQAARPPSARAVSGLCEVGPRATWTR